MDYFSHETAVIDEGCKIGKGTKIWHFSHIMSNSKIGENCNLGQNVVVSPNVVLGTNNGIHGGICNVRYYSSYLTKSDIKNTYNYQ